MFLFNFIHEQTFTAKNILASENILNTGKFIEDFFLPDYYKSNNIIQS